MLALLCAAAPLPALAAESGLGRLLEGLTGRAAAREDVPVADGLREALRIGAERSVARLGARDGYNGDPAVHIPLPRKVEKARKVLRRIGMSGSLDELEVQINRAAEAAAPQARQLFVDAVTGMTFDDAVGILRGPDDAATRYLERGMRSPLAVRMRPIVEQSLAQVGAVRTMNQVLERYRSVPFAPAVDTDLTGYVVDRALDGLFLYVAREEAAIRKDPVRRTTDLLRKVFGGG